MIGKLSLFIVCGLLALILPNQERAAFAADVETVGNLEVQGTVRAGGGITFPDNSTQTSACSGCANGILDINLGGTSASSALQARTNLDVPGLSVPNTFIAPNTFTASNTFTATNTFTAHQTIEAGLSLTENLYLPATSSSAGAIYSGSNTLIHTYGSSSYYEFYNFFAGINAGNLTTSGVGNSAIGSNALHSNADGSFNTATGAYALYANTSGSNNVANGLSALSTNTTGYNNTAVGNSALQQNTAGTYNTAIGSTALFSNTTAGRNTALGAISLYLQDFSNSDAVWNSDNTAVGYEALRNNRPSAATNGIQNTALGSGALRNNSTGKNNTASGYFALYSNTTGIYNTANGHDALSANITGQNNTAIGYAAGKRNTTGHANTYVGMYADAASEGLGNATAIGHAAIVDASNHVRIGNTYVTQIGGQVGWSNLSDRRVKSNIRDIPQGLNLIRALRPVEFTMKEGNGRIDFGFIAQDVEVLLGTDYNILGIGSDPNHTLSLRYTDFIAPMVKAMQEQQEMIERQTKIVAQQGEVIDTLKEEITELRRLLAGKQDK